MSRTESEKSDELVVISRRDLDRLNNSLERLKAVTAEMNKLAERLKSNGLRRM